MESKLKALKVVELKDILAKAEVAIQGKANKPDLITKILASPGALKVYEQQHGSLPAGDALETPALVSAKPASTVQTGTIPPAVQAEPISDTQLVSTSKPAPPVASSSASAPSSLSKSKASATAELATVVADEDEELQKRKARAERFGIALVEPTKPKEPKLAQKSNGAKPATSAEDSAILTKRAQRFGIQNTPAVTESQPTKGGKGKGNKRSAPVTETVDAEELERRKKRAERFGTGNQAAVKA